MHGRCFFGCIWILLLSPIFEVKSQNSDSLLAVYHSGQEGQAKLSTLHQLFLSYLNNDPAKAAEYAKEQLDYAESISDLTGIGMAYYNFGVLANNRNQFDSAAYWYQEALGFFEEADNPTTTADTAVHSNPVRLHQRRLLFPAMLWRPRLIARIRQVQSGRTPTNQIPEKS